MLDPADARRTGDAGGHLPRFERMFAPLRLGARQLQSFLFRLHELGLIVADTPGQGEVLRRRAATGRHRTWIAALSNPLAIRLPGVGAGPFVNWLYGQCRWMFGTAFLGLCMLLVLAAASLVVVQFGAFQARLPDFWSFFNVRSAAWFAVALMGIKILHEFGHALACRHFGGQCREIGVIVLVGTPALYCDVSDAWRLESKWQRIIVSAGGMLVELVLAAVCTLLWWFSEPGLLNAICLRVMFLCSVSTVLFNANPLLRCDGYYILSDLVNVPNLWQESRALLQRKAARWLWGIELPDDPTIPPRLHKWLLLYAVGSIIYCTLLVIGILWFCLQVAEPQGLAPVALGLIAFVLVGMAVPPAQRAAQSLLQPMRWRKISRGRTALTVVVALALISAALFVPLPYRVSAPVWLEPQAAQPVYVSVAGTLRDAVPPGTQVVENQQIAKLTSPDVEARLAELTAELAREEKRLKNLRILLTDDPSVAPLIPAAEKAREDIAQRLAQCRLDDQRLSLKAPIGGRVLPPPVIAPPPAAASSLAGWQGTPLDRPNRGCYLESGELVCLIGDPQRLEAMLVIDQSAVPFVRVGQAVRIRVEQGPVIVLSGKIAEIAKTDAEDLPESLALALDLPLNRNAGEGPQTTHLYYQARVAIDRHSPAPGRDARSRQDRNRLAAACPASVALSSANV